VIDVEKVLASLDITLYSQRGVEVNGLCPMHKERVGKDDQHPSWWINTESGAHICFSCGYKGNLYTLVSDLKKTGYYDARELINTTTELPISALQRRIKDLPEYVHASEPIGISEARLAVYCDPPLSELKKRFITVETAKHHGVLWGINNSAWIFPIRNPDDYSLWGWQEKAASGRFFRNQPQGVKKSRTVFGVEVMSEETLLVVESPLDVVRLAAAGVAGAISTYGALPSVDQVKIMRRAKRVIAAFDNDPAGKKACEILHPLAKKYGISLSYFDYTGIDVKDPGDMVDAEIYLGIKNSKDSIYGAKAYL